MYIFKCKARQTRIHFWSAFLNAHTGGNTMNKMISICAIVSVAVASNASDGRVIVEDFDGAGFNPELTFDFSSDFTGEGDTSDHMDGVLWLYSDLADVSVNTLAPGEWIESVEVTWTDFCGTGCTNLEIFGLNNSLAIGNTDIAGSETVLLTSVDIGESIQHFTISSFEGRIEEVVVTVVPTPGPLALVGVGALAMIRRKR